MILLEFHNRIIEDTLTRVIGVEKPETVLVTIADFDGAVYKLESVESKTKVRVSLQWPCFKQLSQYNVQSILEREYGSMLVEPISGFDVSIEIDANTQNKDEDIRKASLLKRNVFAAPFEQAFKRQAEGKTDSNHAVVHYRDDSSVYIQASSDRVTCVFSTTFKDEDDVVIGKVYLQEFLDVRKERHLQQAPQVLISQKEPPRELAGTQAVTGDNIGYVTFVLFPRHFMGDKADNCINLLQTFRNYLHYHIKCSKAYLHCRMRARVASSVKILNRAKPEVEKEKKTASGRTFHRK